jgi:anti-sigma regulatory factor (Ser/Thr protein kinase)
MEKIFSKDLSALDSIFDFINQFVQANHIAEEASYAVNLAVEELFTNMVKYNAENRSDISITLEKDQNKLIVTMIDFDAERFDVTKANEVDTKQALQDRRIGGLGIHLTKKMIDEIRYEYANRQGKVILTKNLEM